MPAFLTRAFSRTPARQSSETRRYEASSASEAFEAYVAAGAEPGFDLLRVWLEDAGEGEARNFDLPPASAGRG